MGVAGRRLIARRLRPSAIVAVLACAAGVTVVGARYAGVSAPGGIDRAVDPRLIDSLGRQHTLAEDLVKSGSPASVAVLTVLLVAVLLYLRRPRGAVLAALAAPVASAITEWMLKPIVERSRGGSLSYPSGHTTGIFAVAVVIAMLVLDRTPPRPRAAVGAIRPRTAVYGVEPDLAHDARDSLAAGRLVPYTDEDRYATIADGMRTHLSEPTPAHLRANLDGILTVTDCAPVIAESVAVSDRRRYCIRSRCVIDQYARRIRS
jgi:hypothetical protein